MTDKEKLLTMISASGACFNTFPVEDFEREEQEKLADYLILNGVTIQKWIPVTERLPNYSDGLVLVTDGKRIKIFCGNDFYENAIGGIRCAQGQDYGSGMDVTHWMPLPEPPKEE